MDFMNLNQAAHGDREFGYALTRMGVRRKVVVGHTSDTRVPDGDLDVLVEEYQ
jgi:L-arabinose isomerase